MINNKSPIHLNLDDIHVGYPGHQSGSLTPVVKGLSLSLRHGKIGCLLGPSGCGKSTILRAICGFEPIQSGSITLDEQQVSTPNYVLAPEKRRIGVVFQDYALFPHLTNAENVAFGLRGSSKKIALQQAEDWLVRVGLHDVGHRYPHELSGGQQQRVALARAMAPEPELLLLDEPFSNLDVDLRERLAGEVRDILKANGTTALLVTHDQFEAFAIADDIGVMLDGCLVQWDSAYNLYHRPANRFVASFIGHGVFVPGVTQAGPSVAIELGLLPLPQSSYGLPGEEVEVLLRADDIVHDDDSSLLATVISKAFRGGDFLYTLRLDSGQELMAMVPSHHNHEIGEKIGIKLVADHVVSFSKAHT
jgi:iron(III) transport system ATP-binding protein